VVQLPTARGFRVGRRVLICTDGARRHLRVHRIPDQAAPGLLDRVRAHRRDGEPGCADPLSVRTPALRRRRAGPRRRLDRRTHRPDRPLGLGERDAGDRAQRTPAPRRPVTVYRPRRLRLTASDTKTAS
jgi:hypothetical protein